MGMNGTFCVVCLCVCVFALVTWLWGCCFQVIPYDRKSGIGKNNKMNSESRNNSCEAAAESTGK